VTRHWSASCSNTNQVFTNLQTNAKLPPCRRFVVPVVVGYKLLRLFQGNRVQTWP